MSGRGGCRLRDGVPGARAMCMAVALAALVLVAGVRPALPQNDPVAIKAALDRVQAEVRTVEGELRQAVARARAIRPGTPLADREAIARRIVELRQRLDRLKADLEAERQRIATVSEASGLVVVADVVGLSTAQAEQALRAAGLVPATRGSGGGSAGGFECVDPRGRALRPDRGGVNTCPSPLVPSEWLTGTPAAGTGTPAAGTVQSQAPAAGARVPRGTTVTLVVGASPAPAVRAVPDIRGLDHAEATARLQAAGLVADFVGGDPPRSSAEAHRVQWTRPAAGATAAPGSRVEVAIRPGWEAPAATVPDVRSLDHAQATARLQAAGLVADFVGGDPPRSSAEAHRVQWTRPAAGATAAPGSRVEVAIRPEYREPATAMPDVRGLDHVQATARLQAAGLVPDFVGGDPPRSRADEHRVQWTKPAAGAAAAPGSRVEVAIRPEYREPAAPASRIPPGPAVPPGPEPAPSREVLSGPVTCPPMPGPQGAVLQGRLDRSRSRQTGTHAIQEMWCDYWGSGAGFSFSVVDAAWVRAGAQARWEHCGKEGYSAFNPAQVFRGVPYPRVNFYSMYGRSGMARASVRSTFPVENLNPAVLRALADFLARELEPRAAPCSGATAAPPPPEVQPQPPPPRRGGVLPVPSWPPPPDPCPGRRPLGQSDSCE